MNEKSRRIRQEFYIVYCLAAATLIVSITMLSPALVVLSGLLLAFSVIMLHSGHIINNVLIKGSRVIEISGNYQLGQNLSSMSRKSGNVYTSISIARLKPRSTMINTSSMRELMDSLSERFEFSVELAEIDKAKIVEALKTKLRTREIALARVDQKSYDKISSLKRQIDIINGEVASIASGGKSFEFEIKLKSIFTSEDRSEAESYSSKNVESLANKFSASLGVDYQILSGEELLCSSGV